MPGVKSMSVQTFRKQIATNGNGHILDITSSVAGAVRDSSLDSGLATVFITGSTASVTTVEFEPGLVADLAEAFERLFPKNKPYRHHETAGDDNGHSHVRAAVLGPSLSAPFVESALLLGTWQQIVLIDFDTSPRQRDYVIQILG